MNWYNILVFSPSWFSRHARNCQLYRRFIAFTPKEMTFPLFYCCQYDYIGDYKLFLYQLHVQKFPMYPESTIENYSRTFPFQVLHDCILNVRSCDHWQHGLHSTSIVVSMSTTSFYAEWKTNESKIHRGGLGLNWNLLYNGSQVWGHKSLFRTPKAPASR